MRHEMRHEMLTQRALFCHHANTKPGTPSQHFVMHSVQNQWGLMLHQVITDVVPAALHKLMFMREMPNKQLTNNLPSQLCR